MAASMEFIARLVADGSSDTMLFTSIPQTFTDIWAIGCCYHDDSATAEADQLQVRPNSDSNAYYMAQIGTAYNNNSASQIAGYTWGDSSFKSGQMIPSTASNYKYPACYFSVYIANYTDSWDSSNPNYMNLYGNFAGFTGPRTSPADTASRQGDTRIVQGRLGATTTVMPMTSLYFHIATDVFEAGSVITLYGIDAS